MTLNKVERGGRRKGAGRKPLGAKAKSATITLRVTEELKQALKDEAKSYGVSVGELLESMFLGDRAGS